MPINTDELLRKYIPNALATVEGEQSLYEKLEPFLGEASDFIVSQITGEQVLAQIIADNESSPLKAAFNRAYFNQAYLKAIPSLDLVLTPNGFGIVSNQNIAPASKERVERLMANVEQQRDDAIINLLNKLRKETAWIVSDQGNYWAETLFPNIDVCEKMGLKEHRWEEYQRLRPQIIAIETQIANGFISPELMKDLHWYQFGESHNELTAEARSAWAYLITRLQSEILYQLGGQPPRHLFLADMVQFIRNNIELFTQWAGSNTAKLYTPPVFENKKEAPGYFF